MCVLNHSVVFDFETLWTVVHQAPLSMGFPRQEYWNGLPFLSPGDLPNPGIKPVSVSRTVRWILYHSITGAGTGWGQIGSIKIGNAKLEREVQLWKSEFWFEYCIH